jgi:hypothetical protein
VWDWRVAVLAQRLQAIAAQLGPAEDARALTEAARRLRNLSAASADVLLLAPKLDRLRQFVEGGLVIDVGGNGR